MAEPDYYDDSTGLTPEEETEEIKGDESTGRHFLDKDKKTLRYFRMIKNWFAYELDRQASNRKDRIKQHEYRDGNQWDADDKAEVEARGQKALVYNRIKPTLDWIIGTEKRTRVDFYVLPRRKEESKPAESKTKLLKFIDDVSKAAFARSLAFEDSVTSGLGWMDVGIRSDDTEDPIYKRYEDWRNAWHDSNAKERDLSDGRYLFRQRIVDYDIAVAMFPERKGCIRACLNDPSGADVDVFQDGYEAEVNPELAEMSDGSPEGAQRNRVRLISCEYRVPARVKVLRGKGLGSLNGSVYDKRNKGMNTLVRQGHASLYDAIRMEMWKMIFCGKYVLQNEKRPYNHDRFSLIPIWGYRRKKDGMPYGATWQIMDPQDDLNKRHSKSLYILSTKQALLEEGAVDDIDDFVDEKNHPDGVMQVKEGKMDKVKLLEDRGMAREHVMLMEQDAQYIESIGGVTDENRGMQTNATSGKAIRARQDQGHTTTAAFFDNARFAFQLEGEITLSLAEQYYTEEKVFRLTGERSDSEFVEINKPGPEGEVLNDVTSTQADFIIDAQSYYATMRQAMFEQVGETLKNLPPEIQIRFYDLWFDLSDLPEREVWVQRARMVNGMEDPDEDPEDPEVLARKEQQAAEEEKQKQLEEAMLNLELALKEAMVEKTKSETEENYADIERILADAKQKLESIRQKADEIRIKKADVLNKIEQGERVDANKVGNRPATP